MCGGKDFTLSQTSVHETGVPTAHPENSDDRFPVKYNCENSPDLSTKTS